MQPGTMQARRGSAVDRAEQIANTRLAIAADPEGTKKRLEEIRAAEAAQRQAEADAATAKAAAEAARDESNRAGVILAEQRRALESDRAAFAASKARVEADLGAREQALKDAQAALAAAQNDVAKSLAENDARARALARLQGELEQARAALDADRAKVDRAIARLEAAGIAWKA